MTSFSKPPAASSAPGGVELEAGKAAMSKEDFQTAVKQFSACLKKDPQESMFYDLRCQGYQKYAPSQNIAQPVPLLSNSPNVFEPGWGC